MSERLKNKLNTALNKRKTVKGNEQCKVGEHLKSNLLKHLLGRLIKNKAVLLRHTNNPITDYINKIEVK